VHGSLDLFENSQHRGVCEPSQCNTLYVFRSGVPPNYVELRFDAVRSVASPVHEMKVMLWFSGALERWPRIRFVFSDRGGALPMVADRIDKFGHPGKEPVSQLHDAATQFGVIATADAPNTVRKAHACQ
jgi:hypothetical protein